jgi:phosphoadenosine phosphosulfate reductase
MTLADKQWGAGAGRSILHDPEPIILNPCPGPDRLEEFIINGTVVGSIQFSNKTMSSSLILRESGGRRLSSSGFLPSKGYVVIDETVVPFLLDGKNLLSPGIVDADTNIKEGDEVLILDRDNNIIAAGNARKDGSELVGTKGLGVKIRWANPPMTEEVNEKSEIDETFLDQEIWIKTWDRVLEINDVYLSEKINRAKYFIKKLTDNDNRPIAVSYSGGKDSLATLYLALDSGLRPPVIFIDTGLEFPETLDHVHSLIEDLGLELFEGRPISGFFENLEKFGPPGRDYRWCCKICKLGPTTRVIEENFSNGVITLIGQRRFESDQRERKGAVWKNPWVPKQMGASPVQNWTALDVWLYIFKKKAPYNPLYSRGFQRIGCWLCPSCDLAETVLVNNTDVDRRAWDIFLENEREEAGLPEDWITMGFHRFKNLPPHMIRLANEMELDPEFLTSRKGRRSETSILEMVEGTNTCDDGISREGLIGMEVPWDIFIALLNILGRVEVDEGTGGVSVIPNTWEMRRKAIEVFKDGTLVIRAPNERDLKVLTGDLLSVIKRAIGCIGCSICVGRCPTGAILVENERGRIRMDSSICTHCSSCLGPCPAEAYVDDPFKI